MTKNRLGLLDSQSRLTVAQQSSSLVFEGVKNPNERESNARMTKRGFFWKNIYTYLNQTFSIFHTFISTVNECCLSPNLWFGIAFGMIYWMVFTDYKLNMSFWTPFKMKEVNQKYISRILAMHKVIYF